MADKKRDFKVNFRLFDDRGDDCVPATDVINVARAMGLNPSIKEVNQLLSQNDDMSSIASEIEKITDIDELNKRLNEVVHLQDRILIEDRIDELSKRKDLKPDTTSFSPADKTGQRYRNKAKAGGMSSLVDKFGGNKPAPGGGANISRSATSAKQYIIDWAKDCTKDYENVNITNLSSSWANGLAFCAVIHSYYPKAFDYSKLSPKKRKYNFRLAFDAAEKLAGIPQLIEVEDMLLMGDRPDYKVVFTYVQTMFQKLRNITPPPPPDRSPSPSKDTPAKNSSADEKPSQD